MVPERRNGERFATPRSSRRVAATARTSRDPSERAKPRKLTTRGVATRARLITGARQVFEEAGFVDARIGDIANAANTSHGSFYTYFDSKEEILIAAAKEVFDELRAATRLQLHAKSATEAIEIVNVQYLDAWIRNKQMMRTIHQASGFLPEILEELGAAHRLQVSRYANTLQQMQNDGLIYTDLDPYHTACALGSMVEQSIQWWIGRDEPYTRATALDTLNKLWIRAIGLVEDDGKPNAGNETDRVTISEVDRTR
jgi:AcrR family transcriptional regulator